MANEKLLKIQKRIEGLKREQDALAKESLEIQKKEGGNAMYSIRPAGRHVLTIGEDLIQDQCAAIIELVKNAYDADSEKVEIVFTKNEEGKTIIIVRDKGHGMSTEDIVQKWLVPSTTSKLTTRVSPNGRVMQGRKGIGRYAASMLGNLLYMKTVDNRGVLSEISIDWDDFKNAEFLDQAQVNLSSCKTTEESGTEIRITVRESDEYWCEKKFEKLIYELKRMVSRDEKENGADQFSMYLIFDNYYKVQENNISILIEPYPIFELYDYRISGQIHSDGCGELTYETQKVRPSTKEIIKYSFGRETQCGNLRFDIRVYDRDSDSIEGLIHRGNGLKNRNGNYVSKTEAKNLLNSVNGIGVYRNHFRIRPLGDADFDWLMLNKERIQNPSLKIGSDQVTGVVEIESEELSNLEEKSARDGLKDNDAYNSLKTISKEVIAELEKRRFVLRRSLGLSKPKEKIERQLSSLYDYSDLKKSVKQTLQNAGVNETDMSKIDDLISKEAERNNATVDEIKKTIAIYQGQATVGKIVHIFLHEGRRPLNYLKGQVKNIKHYGQKFEENRDDNSVNKIIKISDGMGDNAQIFVKLFDKMDPLAAKKRETKKEFNVFEVINGSKDVFESVLLKEGISFTIECEKDLSYYGWKQDFYTIFTNLIDNSIYWLVKKRIPNKEICIRADKLDEGLCITYSDSGPGIEKDLLESGIIFEPDFSTKEENPSGLGLAIAGEAAERNNMELSAKECETGALFVLEGKEVK